MRATIQVYNRKGMEEAKEVIADLGGEVKREYHALGSIEPHGEDFLQVVDGFIEAEIPVTPLTAIIALSLVEKGSALTLLKDGFYVPESARGYDGPPVVVSGRNLADNPARFAYPVAFDNEAMLAYVGNLASQNGHKKPMEYLEQALAHVQNQPYRFVPDNSQSFPP